MHLLAIFGVACLWCAVASCLCDQEWRRRSPLKSEEHAAPPVGTKVDEEEEEEQEDEPPPPSYAEAAVLG